ncbi:hypothetical protein SUGI_0487210 [Cryptomeria japonica]|nr:hypothetical protein SUGI_0487210 [Cryptomeria japonica]
MKLKQHNFPFFFYFLVIEDKSIKRATIRTVGPLLPSAFLDGNNPQDQDVGTHLWKAENCIDWLNTKEASTVAYVSFGSIALLSKEQITEIALGLKASQHFFLWVIRPAHDKEESNNIDGFLKGFLEETADQGLVVSWCPQMAVLNHPSVDVWKTGIRLNKSRDGLVGRDEVEKSVKTIMESEEGAELRKNALHWKTLAKKAMVKAGSSDKNIDCFVHEIIARTTFA